MVKFSDLLKLVFGNLMAHRGRAALTMFGIAWGIATVVYLIAMVSGFKVQNVKQMNSWGVNMLVLDYQRYYDLDGTLMPLTHDVADAAYIVENCPYVVRAVPRVENWARMSAGDKERRFNFIASTPDVQQQMEIETLHGRFFNSVDYDTESKVVVVGHRVAEHFWGEGENAVGEQLTASGTVFDVIGQVDRQRTSSDWSVYVPLSVYEGMFGRVGEGNAGALTIYATLDNVTNFDKGSVMVRRLLAAKHGFGPDDENAIRLRDYSEWREEATRIFLMFFALFYSIGLITLAIGAVGVMNVMLISVQERTREIGLRKALGATPGSILLQFILEALLITLIAGFIGLTVGLMLSGIMRQLPLPDEFPPPVITAAAIYVAVTVNVVVGILAGALPARQAARLDPIVSMRAE